MGTLHVHDWFRHSDLKAEVFRALWIQGAGIVGIYLAIGGLLFAAIRFLD